MLILVIKMLLMNIIINYNKLHFYNQDIFLSSFIKTKHMYLGFIHILQVNI